MQRLTQVEQHGAATFKCIGELKSIARHCCFRVMWSAGWSGNRHGSHGLPVVSRLGVGVNHRKKVATLLGIVPRPHEQIRIALAVPACHTKDQHNNAEEITHGLDSRWEGSWCQSNRSEPLSARSQQLTCNC